MKIDENRSKYLQMNKCGCTGGSKTGNVKIPGCYLMYLYFLKISSHKIDFRYFVCISIWYLTFIYIIYFIYFIYLIDKIDKIDKNR